MVLARRRIHRRGRVNDVHLSTAEKLKHRPEGMLLESGMPHSLRANVPLNFQG